MAVDSKTFDRIAQLAKLEFNEEEKISILGDMNKMVDFINKLEEVDTTGIEPLIYLLDEKTTLRPDEVKQTITQAEALKNAPDKDSDFIKVPKVMEQ
tara:strand:+ start:2251 stop:2541 length:291 start_codon:yes stop_codon:yes gene_type:complete